MRALGLLLWREPAAFLGALAAACGLIATTVPMPAAAAAVLAGAAPLLAAAATRARVVSPASAARRARMQDRVQDPSERT